MEKHIRCTESFAHAYIYTVQNWTLKKVKQPYIPQAAAHMLNQLTKFLLIDPLYTVRLVNQIHGDQLIIGIVSSSKQTYNEKVVINSGCNVVFTSKIH